MYLKTKNYKTPPKCILKLKKKNIVKITYTGRMLNNPFSNRDDEFLISKNKFVILRFILIFRK